MTTNKDKVKNNKNEKPNTWTAYGDPLKNSSPNRDVNSPILEKAKQDGNIVKGLKK